MKKAINLISLFLVSSLFLLAASVSTVGVPHPSGSAYIETYAHRGTRAFSPENTPPSYATGLAVGTNWVDCDVSITKDGVIIVDHDAFLNPDIVSIRGTFWATSKGNSVKTLSSMS